MRTVPHLLLLAAVGAAAPARAEAPPAADGPAICARYEIHARYLAEKLGEFPMFSGVSGDGIALQLFVNRNTGTWTALLVRNDGVSCITSAGENGREEVGL